MPQSDWFVAIFQRICQPIKFTLSYNFDSIVKMASECKLTFDSIKQIFKIDNIQSFQEESLRNLLNGRDVFVSIRTGGGKSICYQAFQLLSCEYNNRQMCTVLIVTPLISIMKEQCDYLNSLGFTATYIGKESSENGDILNGNFQFLFSSPELLLSVPKWREMLVATAFVKLFVVDEAHTVLHWSESDSTEDPFREWYGKLGEVRSFIQCPFLVITVTANKSARKKMQTRFCMSDCHEIVQRPDRSNIKLFCHKLKSSVPLEVIFNFLITHILDKKQDCQRYIIFCPSIKICSGVYTMFRLTLGLNIKYVQMYHSQTTDTVKESIKQDMKDENGLIRILVATSAAGMGVNFQGVNSVINFGPPKDMDSFVQQFGRASRDGKQASALLMFNGKQCRKIDADMKSYISNTSECRRAVILKAYNSKPSTDLYKHLCCDICSKIFECNNTDCASYIHPFFEFTVEDYSSTSDSSCDELKEFFDTE